MMVTSRATMNDAVEAMASVNQARPVTSSVFVVAVMGETVAVG